MPLHPPPPVISVPVSAIEGGANAPRTLRTPVDTGSAHLSTPTRQPRDTDSTGADADSTDTSSFEIDSSSFGPAQLDCRWWMQRPLAGVCAAHSGRVSADSAPQWQHQRHISPQPERRLLRRRGNRAAASAGRFLRGTARCDAAAPSASAARPVQVWQMHDAAFPSHRGGEDVRVYPAAAEGRCLFAPVCVCFFISLQYTH